MSKAISEKVLKTVQHFTALDSVSASAVRGQMPGTKAAIEKYLAAIEFEGVSHLDYEGFSAWLDNHTKCIQRKLPARAGRVHPWGVARKSLNLFLRSCSYNYYLRTRYSIDKISPWLEVPLDSVVAKELRKWELEKHPDLDTKDRLPRWKGLIHLEQPESDQYQGFARKCAKECDLDPAVLLDNVLWLRGRGKK